jgi:multisubunit Na+/H+ antiporter MnhB subunit
LQVGEDGEEVAISGVGRLRLWCYHLCENGGFQGGVMLAIAFNTVLLALEHHNMPQGMVDFLGVCNIGGGQTLNPNVPQGMVDFLGVCNIPILPDRPPHR